MNFLKNLSCLRVFFFNESLGNWRKYFFWNEPLTRKASNMISCRCQRFSKSSLNFHSEKPWIEVLCWLVCCESHIKIFQSFFVTRHNRYSNLHTVLMTHTLIQNPWNSWNKRHAQNKSIKSIYERVSFLTVVTNDLIDWIWPWNNFIIQKESPW